MPEPYIIFQIAGTRYAVRAPQVQQVEMIDKITRVPNAPNFVEGIIYLRGQVVPVINLRKRFGMEAIPYDLRSRLVVIQVDQRTVAMAVDTAREFVQIAEEQILPPPESLSGPEVEYLAGMVSLQEDVVLIVDLQRLLSFQEREQISTAF